VDEKLTAFRFLKDNDNNPNRFNTESGVLVHVSNRVLKNLDELPRALARGKNQRKKRDRVSTPSEPAPMLG